MKKLTIIISLFTLWVTMSAQTFDVDLHYVVKKNYNGWKPNQEVHIVKIEPHNVFSDPKYPASSLVTKMCMVTDDDYDQIIDRDIAKILECKYQKVMDVWDNLFVMNKIQNDFAQENPNLQLREEMREDAFEFLSRKHPLGDAYLKSYITSLVCKIVPRDLMQYQKPTFKVVVLESSTINSMSFIDGTIVVTTGLLAQLHTEAELVAILSREIAHIILDYQFTNVTKAIARQRRSEFWSAVAVGLALAASDIAASQNHSYYTPAFATYGAILANEEISSQVVDRLGINFTDKQNQEADEVARNILKTLGYDESALSTANYRFLGYYNKYQLVPTYFGKCNKTMFGSRFGPEPLEDIEPETRLIQNISAATTCTAMLHFFRGDYRIVLPFVEQNIKAGVATADDYLLKANSLLNLHDDQETYQEVRSAIAKAREVDAANINSYKPEILLALRENKLDEALQLLANYETVLKADVINADKNALIFLSDEQVWVKNMQIKLKAMR